VDVMLERLSAVDDKFREIEDDLARAASDHQRVAQLAQLQDSQG
jgi:hypothetical protein